MIKTIIDYWYIILAVIALGACAGYAVAKFVTLPSDEQLEKVRQWLLIACTKAEAELGSGTGKLKLPYVYDLFVSKFPWLSKIVTFATFSGLVDEALVTMRELLAKNANAEKLVKEKEI